MESLMPHMMDDGERRFLTFYDVETGEDLAFDWLRPGKLGRFNYHLLTAMIYRNLGKPPRDKDS